MGRRARNAISRHLTRSVPDNSREPGRACSTRPRSRRSLGLANAASQDLAAACQRLSPCSAACWQRFASSSSSGLQPGSDKRINEHASHGYPEKARPEVSPMHCTTWICASDEHNVHAVLEGVAMQPTSPAAPGQRQSAIRKLLEKWRVRRERIRRLNATRSAEPDRTIRGGPPASGGG
jgi:hypothetical protein